MSRLKLYWPEAHARGPSTEESEPPPIIPFARFVERFRGQRLMETAARARIIHANSRCPVCRHPVTEPIELNDGFINRNNLPIPGTATLVGFRCQRCTAEWPA